MSFLAPKPDLPTDSAPERQSYEASGPVPVGFGRFRVGLKLLEAPFNHRQFNHGSRLPKGNCYTIVAAGCHGPVKGIFRMWLNGKPRWQFQCMREGDEMYRDISYSYADVPWYARIYWGDPNQSIEPLLNGTGTAKTLANGQIIQPPQNPNGTFRAHPPYSGIFYIVFYSLHFDFPNDNYGQTTLPSMEAEVLVAPQTNIALSDVDMQFNGVNPVMAAYDLLTNPVYGADLPSSLVASSDWIEKAQALKDTGYHNQTGGLGNLSPVWADNRTLAQTLGDLFYYYDGFVRLKNGRLLPDYFPNQAFDPGSLTTLTRNDCLEEADVDPEGWEDTLSELTIKYRSNGLLEEEAITERSTYNLRVTDRGARKTIDAPFIIHGSQARRMAQRILTIKSQPGFKARLKVMRERARNPDGSLLMPGDLVYLNYEPYALQMLCRIIEREDRRGEVTLSLVNERGKFAEDFVAAPDERLLPKIEDPGTVANWKVLELPEELAGTGWPPKLAVLAQRPNASVLAAKCYLSKTGLFAGEEQELSSITAFAVRASLVGSMEAGDTEVTFAVADPDPDLAMYRDYTAAEQANGYVMAMIGDELISLGTIVPNEGTHWTFAASRGVFGTTAGSHTTGAEIFIFKRGWLPMMAVEHEMLKWSMPYTEAGATVHLRLAAANGWEVGDPNTAKTIVLRERASQDTPITQFTVFAWRRSTTTPTAPTGGTYAEPAPTADGWALTQPTGTDPLWMSRRTYYSDQDPTAWTDPVRVSGQDGASPRVYTIDPSAAVIVFDDPDFDPVSITATGYVTVGNERSVVSSQEAYLESDVYRSGSWHQISLPYDLAAGDQRVRFTLEDAGSSAVLAEVIVPVVRAGQTGPEGSPGETGASTLMAFGRFLEQPEAPTETGAPPSDSWSLDSENAPGNSIYPLWVTVGTRPQGGLQWTWQLPWRFTPEKGEKGDKGDQGDEGTSGTSTAHLTAYRRSSTLLSTAPTGGSYNFDTQILTPPTAWSEEIPSGDDPLYAVTTLAAVPGPSGVDNALTWTVPRKIAENGQSGISTAQVFAYKRSTTNLDETPTGGNYNFDTRILTPPSSPDGWQTTVPADPSEGLVYVSTATAAVVGQSGTDSDIVWTQSRRLTDDMLLADGSVDASKIAPNAVTTAKIAANAVTAVKIAAGAIETDKLAANAVTAAKIAANAITAANIDVGTLAAIQTNTGNLVVDGEVRSGVYTSGASGWKIKSDGTAEFNELTLRKGIITPDDILLHDPSILLYNPNFTVPHATLPNLAAGWGRWYYDISGSAEWIERGDFGPNYRTDANSPGVPGIGMRFRPFWSDNQWAFIRSANALKIPVLAGERFMARALCKNPGLRILIVFYGADGVWIGNAQIPDQIDTLLSPAYDREEWGYLEFAFRVPENVRFLTYELHRGRNEDNGYAEGAPNESGASTNLDYACFCGGCVLHRMPGFIHPEALPRPELPTPSQTFSGSIEEVMRPSVPPGLTLRYTIDGSEVTEMSPVWSNDSLTFTVDTTLRVRFFDAAGFFGPEATANFTRVAEPQPAPLARPIVSFSETGISLTITSISRPDGGGTTTHLSVNGGTATTSTDNPWSPSTVLHIGDSASIWATDGSGNSSPTLTYSKLNLPGDGGYIIV